MPEDTPDRMPEDLPDRMPEDMSDRMPEDLPDRMTVDMSDSMPEYLAYRKCINVMVGITRSKVIIDTFILSRLMFPMMHQICQMDMWHADTPCGNIIIQTLEKKYGDHRGPSSSFVDNGNHH
jgi:hypothetical protein